jgi:putative ABC transport system substrate-binding protein
MRFTRLAVLTSLSLMLLTGGLAADAQPPTRVPRVGYLVSRGAPGPNDQAFQDALRNLGYVEGQNLVMERRWAAGDPDRLRTLAAELVRLKVDVIFAGGGTIEAVKQATATIPVVFMTEGDPVKAGFIASFGRPGGNMTGLTVFADELATKRLELIKEVLPTITRVGVLRHATSDVSHLRATEAAAPALRLYLRILEVKEPTDLDTAFRGAREDRVDALVQLPSSFLSTERSVLVALAAKNRLPAIWEQSAFVREGGLVSYGPRLPDLYRRAATYVDKILKGARPGDLPVERPDTFELALNLKTAKALNLTIPPSVLARADEVIE